MHMSSTSVQGHFENCESLNLTAEFSVSHGRDNNQTVRWSQEMCNVKFLLQQVSVQIYARLFRKCSFVCCTNNIEYFPAIFEPDVCWLKNEVGDGNLLRFWQCRTYMIVTVKLLVLCMTLKEFIPACVFKELFKNDCLHTLFIRFTLIREV
jgi:hypothetical protein